jgi:hypothetical protein
MDGFQKKSRNLNLRSSGVNQGAGRAKETDLVISGATESRLRARAVL